MSYREAVEDGVPTKRMRNGATVYSPPCSICGQPSFSFNYIRGNRYVCRDCKSNAGLRKLLKKADEK